jgi:hypothetical protein
MKMTFIHLRSIACGSLVVLALACEANVARANSTAPSQLYGKSITLGWETNRLERDKVSGQTRRYPASAKLKIYVSSSGRIFDQKEGGATPSHSAQEISDSVDNHEVREWRDEAGSLVAYHVFKSGARRMAIRFDPDYRRCSLEVSFAKLNGTENILRQHGKSEILSIEVSSTTCNVQAGNIFQ